MKGLANNRLTCSKVSFYNFFSNSIWKQISKDSKYCVLAYCKISFKDSCSISLSEYSVSCNLQAVVVMCHHLLLKLSFFPYHCALINKQALPVEIFSFIVSSCYWVIFAYHVYPLSMFILSLDLTHRDPHHCPYFQQKNGRKKPVEY